MKLRLSLRGKVISACALAVAIPLLIVGGTSLYELNVLGDYTSQAAYAALSDQAKANLQTGLEADYERVHGFIDHAEMTCRGLAGSSNMRRYLAADSKATDAARLELEKEIQASWRADRVEVQGKLEPMYRHVHFVDAHGGEVFSVKDGRIVAEGLNAAGSEWFSACADLGPGKVHNSGVSVDEGRPVMTVAAPVFVEGRFAGAMCVNFDWRNVRGLMADSVYGRTGYPYIVDPRGLVVTHPKFTLNDEMDITQPRFGVLADITRSEMLAGRTGVKSYTFEGVDKYAAFRPRAKRPGGQAQARAVSAGGQCAVGLARVGPERGPAPRRGMSRPIARVDAAYPASWSKGSSGQPAQRAVGLQKCLPTRTSRAWYSL